MEKVTGSSAFSCDNHDVSESRKNPNAKEKKKGRPNVCDTSAIRAVDVKD